MQTKILVLDDEKEIADLVALYLNNEGYEVHKFYDSKDALEYMKNNRVDLALLDVMMPGIDGFTLCEKIRDKVDCPILFVTAKSEERDLMIGLGVGGDDYIIKPFGIGELRARVAAHLRRELREKKHLVTIGEVEISLQAKQISCKGQQISLTKSEYAICEYLALNRGQVFSKEQIYEHVFGYDGEADSSAITEHIKNIRAKFQKYEVSPVETVWGIGYRWK